MVREAGINDINELAELMMEYRTFYGVKTQTREEVEAFLRERIERNQSKLFVAVTGENEKVGFIQLYPSFSSVSLERQWILNDLYVKEAFRKKGYGTQLMEYVKGYFCDAAKGFVLLTEKDNSTAKRFYSGNGWETDVYDLYTFYYKDVK